jgi:long-subunit fatty acid transport protein
MKNLMNFTLAAVLLASPALSGGWEAGRLDSSMMYKDGSYAEVGTSSIDYDINGTTQASKKHKMAKDQTRTTLGFKTQYGNFDIGLASYMSGAIQLDGQSAHATGCPTPAALCSVVPTADVELDSLALIARYRINENMSVIGGINRYDVSNGKVQTLGGYYVVSGDELVPVAGAAYENKEIALRVELLMQIETDMPLTAASSTNPAVATTSITGAKMAIPQTLTLNFQSGIAEDTLLFGSVHKADWKSAQISIPANAVGPVAAVSSDFANSTAYSIGLGRKINDNFSVLGSYSMEDGSGATGTSPFTLTDGNQTIGLGARYTRDNMTISAGYSYAKVGDVKVTHATGLTADYKDNKVTGLGLKLGFSF